MGSQPWDHLHVLWHDWDESEGRTGGYGITSLVVCQSLSWVMLLWVGGP